MFAKFHEYNVHSMETRFKTQLNELFNQHAMRTRTKSLQLEQMSLSDLDTMYNLPLSKAISRCVLVFDTETTGLINKSLLPLQYKDLALHPYITQLSAVLYDVDNQKVKKVFNTYVKIPDDRLYEDYYFIRYITAKSKIALGRQLSFFDYNLMGGIKVNAADIKAEGEAEVEKIEQEIKDQDTADYFNVWY